MIFIEAIQNITFINVKVYCLLPCIDTAYFNSKRFELYKAIVFHMRFCKKLATL